MIELLAAMTVMLIGLFAVFAVFQAGIVQIRRASTITTAAAIADSEMEKFRAIRYDSIGLANTDVDAADTRYRGDSAYKTDMAVSTTLSAAITDGAQLTITVPANPAGFPTAGPFIVKIDSELILVSDRSSTPWKVRIASERGYLGTTATSHSAGATVYYVQRVNVVKCGSAPCTDSVPTKTVTGADGRAYRVDTYMTWKQITNSSSTSGRLVKLVTVVVRDNTSPYRAWARLNSAFDESTGL